MPETLADTPCFALIETALGWIGLAWTDRGLSRLLLPESDATATRAKLTRLLPDATEAPPRAGIVETLKAYAAGERIDFSETAVDLGKADPFQRAIYAAARGLGYGETTTYGALAAAAGHPGMAREAGEALGRNPVPIVVPCHRIVAAGGKLGGFSAPGGARTKQRLLTMEGGRPVNRAGDQAAFAF